MPRVEERGWLPKVSTSAIVCTMKIGDYCLTVRISLGFWSITSFLCYFRLVVPIISNVRDKPNLKTLTPTFILPKVLSKWGISLNRPVAPNTQACEVR